MPGTLSIVATPIGNLEDMTLRGIKTLKETNLVACEDTRVAAKLLAGLGLEKKPLFALHEHTDEKKIEAVIAHLLRGDNVTYISDAGTPGMNDPGGKLVEAAFEAGIPVTPLPGPSALSAVISVCGFPMEHFSYVGFVPHKKGRETFFRELATREESVIFLESTHRMEKTLESLSKTMAPSRGIFIGRELTKMHETLYRGTIDAVSKGVHATSFKGEFIIVIAPARFKL
ncbi:MAG: 16S rRNA (cytidine(1402)-2'-O)-methyltransferase [Patescibacteria group bacterium]